MLRCFFQQPVGVAATKPGLPTPFYGLLSGPPRSGKTSLLLQFAYNCALEESATVVFICKKQYLDRKPPLLSENMDASSEVFERVHMKYVDDDEGIKKYFSAFHMLRKLPKAVIIDDFCEFFNEWKCRELYGQSRGREFAIIRTLALCRDAIDHANQRLQPETCCKLLISDTHMGEGPRLLYIYQRWLPLIFTIQVLDSSSFILRFCQDGCSQDTDGYAQYSTEQQTLTLEALK